MSNSNLILDEPKDYLDIRVNNVKVDGGVEFTHDQQSGELFNLFEHSDFTMPLTEALDSLVYVRATRIGSTEEGKSICTLYFSQVLGPLAAPGIIRFSGIPELYRPFGNVSVPAPGVQDNNTWQAIPGGISIFSNGTGYIGKSYLNQGTDAFTAGQIGFGAFSVTYLV